MHTLGMSPGTLDTYPFSVPNPSLSMQCQVRSNQIKATQLDTNKCITERGLRMDNDYTCQYQVARSVSARHKDLPQFVH